MAAHAELQLLARIDNLLEALQRANGEIGQMRDEIAVLKGQKARPKFKPSKMDESTDRQDEPGAGAATLQGEKSKRAGSAKRSKTAQLEIHEERVIAPTLVPSDARFKGYRDFVVQGLIIKAHNIRYRLQTWRTREGIYLNGQLPASVQGHHFDPPTAQLRPAPAQPLPCDTTVAAGAIEAMGN